MKIIKEFALELSDPLSTIFNAILRSGTYPQSWKRAVITPIPKKQPVEEMKDLRPISITAIFSRVMESFLSKWVFRDLAPVIDTRQFGNVPGSSTTHYLASLIDSILKGTDKQGMCASLCTIDFAKAFDRVNHNVVIRKLLDYGVQPSILPIICSFLSNRKQAVKVGSSISSDLEVASGVPQGTKLGPVLFLAVVNDAVIGFENRWKYVDDLSLVEVHSCKQPSNLQSEINRLVQWCHLNDVKPNPGKCSVMHFSFAKHPPIPVLQIGESPLPKVEGLMILALFCSKI